MPPHPLKTYLNLTASLPSPPPKKELSKFSYPQKFCNGKFEIPTKILRSWSLLLSGVPSPRPLPLPPLGSQQKKIPLSFAHFRSFCLLVSLRVQIFIVLRRLWSYDDSNTENIYEDTTVMHFRLLLHPVGRERPAPRRKQSLRGARNLKKTCPLNTHYALFDMNSF